MITASQIAPFHNQAIDYSGTVRLIGKFTQLRHERQPFYLTAAEFEEILKWKLGQQFGRQRHIRNKNTDNIISAVTGLALSITHPDEDYELELRLNILCALRGVGVPIASAVLALIFPDKYAVIDFRSWRQVFDENKNLFSVADYKKYLLVIRRLAGELGWTAQEVDHAIWEYDRRYI